MRAIKQSLEILTVQTSTGANGAPLVYIQSTQPTRHNKGDFWIQEGTSRMFYSNGTSWSPVVATANG